MVIGCKIYASRSIYIEISTLKHKKNLEILEPYIMTNIGLVYFSISSLLWLCCALFDVSELTMVIWNMLFHPITVVNIHHGPAWMQIFNSADPTVKW